MDEKNQTQLIETMAAAQNIALVLPTHPTMDATATAVALFQILNSQGKTVTLLSTQDLPKQLSFLFGEIKTTLGLPNQAGLEIRVNTNHAELDQLSYQVETDGIHIFLHAKSGEFLPEDVVAKEPGPACDLLITVGASSLEDLGELYSTQVDLFFKTPKLVIDTNPDNTYFGTQHAVDVTASSVGEIVASAIVASKPEWLSVESATALLTAITSATNSFQSIKTTPGSLSLAADLIARGAKQQDVVLHLYKTKPFPLLKLWGRALARAKFVEPASLLFSELLMSDYAKTETSADLAESVLMELLENSASAHSVALLAETTDGIKLFIASLPHVTQQERLESLGGRVLSRTQVRGLYTLTVLQLPAFDIVQAENALLQAFA
jgi:nanoRNase/pAp phosphatase (c-di-AMP/oligoRNAs hydrolase)